MSVQPVMEDGKWIRNPDWSECMCVKHGCVGSGAGIFHNVQIEVHCCGGAEQMVWIAPNPLVAVQVYLTAAFTCTLIIMCTLWKVLFLSYSIASGYICCCGETGIYKHPETILTLLLTDVIIYNCVIIISLAVISHHKTRLGTQDCHYSLKE